MTRSRLLVLAGVAILAVLALLLFLRFQAAEAPVAQAPPQQMAVVAVKPIKFGEALTPENISEIPWSAGRPDGAFLRKADALTIDAQGNTPRVAMRAIAANELITQAAVSGEASRLSSSPLLGPNMRAIAVPLNEATGAGGFIQPGDRVDLFLTRKLDESMSIADQLVQNVRVLAVGQTADTTREEAAVVKTATIEVDARQAQRVALAQNVGVITVALRNNADDSRMAIPTIRSIDLHDGAGRIFRVAPPPSAAPAAPRPAAPKPEGPAVTVVRGVEAVQVRVAS